MYIKNICYKEITEILSILFLALTLGISKHWGSKGYIALMLFCQKRQDYHVVSQFLPVSSANNLSSREHLRTKVTPDLHLTYSKNGGNLGLILK